MQSEQLTFRFLLTALKPQTYQLTVNGAVVETKKFDLLGNNFIECTFDTEYAKSYAVALHTTDSAINSPVAIVNNVEITWPESEQIQLFWRTLERSENEVWDYFDPDSTKKTQQLVGGRAIRTMSLDYRLNDYRGNGYINNFFEYVGADGTIDRLVDNVQGRPYMIKRPGQFKFEFTAPVAPWLLERLFFVPTTPSPKV